MSNPIKVKKPRCRMRRFEVGGKKTFVLYRDGIDIVIFLLFELPKQRNEIVFDHNIGHLLNRHKANVSRLFCKPLVVKPVFTAA